MKDKEIEKLIDDMRDLLEALEDSIRCPRCEEMVRGDKFNLGSKYNSFEGCKNCYEEIQKENKKA